MGYNQHDVFFKKLGYNTRKVLNVKNKSLVII